jgi:hypothetical protein
MKIFDHIQFFETFKTEFTKKILQGMEQKEAYEVTFKELFSEEFIRLERKLNRAETDSICNLLEEFREATNIYE